MVQVPFGRDRSGRLVPISEVSAAGLACGCSCPCCGTDLVAYIRVERRIPHFGHKADAKCAYAAETAMHLFAKQLIEVHRGITCPAVRVDEDGQGIVEKYPATWWSLVDVALEHRFHEIIPDVVATAAGTDRQLLIEIAVTHEADARKREVLTQTSTPAIEIDLSNWCDMQPEHLAEAILRSAPRRWLFNRHIDAADKRRAKADRLRAEREAAPALAVLRRADAGGKATKAALGQVAKAKRDLHVMELIGFTGLPGCGTPAMSVPDSDWQAVALHSFAAHFTSTMEQMNALAVTWRLRDAGLVRGEFLRLSSLGEQVVREAHPEVRFAEQAVNAYIGVLIERGFLDGQACGKSSILHPAWTLLQTHRAREAEARRLREVELEQKKARAAAEAAALRAKQQREDEERARAVSRDRLKPLVDPIIKRLPEETRAAFDFNTWAATPQDFQTPEQAMMGGASATRFAAELESLLGLFQEGADPARSLLGLPLAQIQEKRAAEQMARRAEFKRLEHERRVAAFIAQAEIDLGPEDPWIEAPHDRLDYWPPARFAAESDGHYAAAVVVLGIERRRREETDAQAQRLTSRMRMIATNLVGEPRGNTWVDTTSRTLRARPRDLCRDAASYQRCLDALEADLRVKVPKRDRQVSSA